MKKVYSLKVLCLVYIRKFLPSEKISLLTLDRDEQNIVVIEGGISWTSYLGGTFVKSVTVSVGNRMVQTWTYRE